MPDNLGEWNSCANSKVLIESPKEVYIHHCLLISLEQGLWPKVKFIMWINNIYLTNDIVRRLISLWFFIITCELSDTYRLKPYCVVIGTCEWIHNHAFQKSFFIPKHLHLRAQ